MNRIPSSDVDRLGVVFDDGSLVADAGLLVAGTLMARLGLEQLLDETVRLGDRVGGSRQLHRKRGVYLGFLVGLLLCLCFLGGWVGLSLEVGGVVSREFRVRSDRLRACWWLRGVGWADVWAFRWMSDA